MKILASLRRAGTMTAFVMLAVGAADAQLAAQPGSLIFHTPGQPQLISLTYNGQPIPASAIQGHKIYIEKNDYDEYFTYGKADGQFSIAANNLTELGTYTLIISTAHGPISIAIETPLDEAPTSIENQAKTLGITVEELKTRLGLFTVTGREKVSFSLPSAYHVGQTLSLSMSATQGRSYVWRINGSVVAEGPEASTLNYTFTQPGVQVVEYVEKKGDAIVASAIGNTTVNAEAPSTVVGAALNSLVTLQAPEGYEQYVWTINGKAVGEGKSFSQTFKEAGKYVVVLESSRPLIEGLPATRHNSYAITVTAR